MSSNTTKFVRVCVRPQQCLTLTATMATSTSTSSSTTSGPDVKSKPPIRQVTVGTIYDQYTVQLLATSPTPLSGIKKRAFASSRTYTAPTQSQKNRYAYQLDWGVQYRYPNVTTLIAATRDQDGKARLEQWQKTQIDSLGYDGYLQASKARLSSGSQLHDAVEKTLKTKSSGQPLDDKFLDSTLRSLPESVHGYYQSFLHILPDFDSAKLTETNIVHWPLCYRGRVDTVANYKNTTRLFEFKTASTDSYHSRRCHSLSDLFAETPLQVAAYAGGINADARAPFKQVSEAGVVFCHESGKAANVVFMDQKDIHYYWDMWLDRLHSFWKTLNRVPVDQPVNFAGEKVVFNE